MARRKRRLASRRLFRSPSGQSELFEKSLEEELEEPESKKIECLGMTFDSEDARREHFLERLREKLQDPQFRKTPGFPRGSNEDILRISDPPWYTACPNPFLTDIARCYGKPYEPDQPYHREPYAVDVSAGKSDSLYKAHGYHTKVPHLAIVPSILHYTEPGDIVLDGFCGSGMTGVAAQWCGRPPASYRKQIEASWLEEGKEKPRWGGRRAILGDLSPAATFIAANYNIPFNLKTFAENGQRLLGLAAQELGWMYETTHTDGRNGRINYTVWSQVFSCPQCSSDVVFVEEALDKETKKTRPEFPCPSCDATLRKNLLERSFETLIDPTTNEPWKRIRLQPVIINYSVDKERFEKKLDTHDLEIVAQSAELPVPPEIPTVPFPIAKMYHGSRLAPKGFTHLHHMFLPRASQALAYLWRQANNIEDQRQRSAMLFLVEQAIWGMSVLARYAPTHYSQVNQYLNGVYYIGSQIVEVSPWYILEGKLARIGKSFLMNPARLSFTATTTGDCANVSAPENSVDYIFTDPPFGSNIFYADLNQLVENWHKVATEPATEAIVDPHKQKKTQDYQNLMRACFSEYYRVLKPGRWMTVVFSNSSNVIWRAIQEAMGVAGFVVANVRSLDKKQGSYRQVTSSAVKRDLVISAYKPVADPRCGGEILTAEEESAWGFVREHLGRVPIFDGTADEAEVIAERTPQVLFDSMVAFHVQRGLSVPMSLGDFLLGLGSYDQRDGMVFLPGQILEYDNRRSSVKKLRQLVLIPKDEASAIQWLRQQLQRRPQRQQDLTPSFHKAIHGWARHEQTIDIRDLLEQNFHQYQGEGPIPRQLVSHLKKSSIWCPRIDVLEQHLGGIPEGGLETEDSDLIRAANELWYVPDPTSQADKFKSREKQLLREFNLYRSSRKRRLKQFRTEAIRVGFKSAYDAQDYWTILAVGKKLPENVLQEDEKLLMYYDVASMRLGED